MPEYLRVYIQTQMRVWIDAEPGRKAKHLAKLAGLTEAQISTAKNHGRGIGYDTAEGMERVLGVTGDELKRRALAAWEEKPEQITAFRLIKEGEALANREMPGWVEAEAVARVQLGLPDWVFKMAGHRTGLTPKDGVTAQYVTDEALQVFRHATPDQVLDRTNVELDQKVAALRKSKRKKFPKPPKADPRDGK